MAVENKRVNRGEKIAFEQEDNIVLVDPNKVVDADGQVSERLVQHENLVMYANLEANIIPRTKLVLGQNTDQISKNVTIANFGTSKDGKVNFLKPQGKDFFDTSYTDQLTGQNARTGGGINQTQEIDSDTNQRIVRSPQDTQLLGITNISIKNNSSFIPQVDIEMVDIQGRTLFELGDNSPYAAFFQLPYPLFYLTVKGYYGKAVKYELMMKSFNARFDPTDGNYKISISFIGRTAALLSDLNISALFALPHMYDMNFSQQENGDGSGTFDQQLTNAINRVNTNLIGSGQETTAVKPRVITRGYNTIQNVYETYISKGLIDKSLPKLTLSEMMIRLQNLEDYIQQQFNKEDLSVLNDITNYGNTVSSYRGNITLNKPTRWAGENLDVSEKYVDTLGNIYYVLKKDKNESLQRQKNAIEDLKSRITKLNNILTKNTTFGEDGSYTILGKTKSSNIPVDISHNDILTTLEYEDIDFEKTYTLRFNATPTPTELAKFSADTLINFEILKKYYNKDLTPDEELSLKFFTFGEINKSSKYKKGSFYSKINNIDKDYSKKSEQIKKELSAALAQKIESPDGGLGFRPTIRNVMAILIANVDAFYRLMDEVHRDAWNLRADPVRRDVIINPESSNGVETKDVILGGGDETNFVFPWPQYFEREYDGKNVKDVVKYIGDPTVEGRTKGYLYDKWPEVEFIEEFIRGDLQRREIQKALTYNNNRETLPSISANAVEYPYNFAPYTDHSEINFLYEIWERTYLASNYTKLFRKPSSSQNIPLILAQFETETIAEAIKQDPFISKKLKNLGINASNFESVLRSISNEGQGISWGKFISDVFVTPYIQEYENNFFGLYPLEGYYDDSPKKTIAVPTQSNLRKYLNSTDNNKLTFTDVYPLTNTKWLKANIQNGGSIASADKANETIKSLFFVDEKKAIASFDPATVVGDDVSYTPSMLQNWQNYDEPYLITPSYDTIKQRFENKIDKNTYYVTEGKIDYGNNYSGFTTRYQTTSLLNTPYFVNSINEAVQNRKNNVENPYVSLGYLFLNSLPLQTLREKMNSGKVDEPFNDYNFAIYNKFSALHKLPYAWVVKYGSIWHRYKKFQKNEGDILDGVWKSINENSLFDPQNSQKSTVYNLPSGSFYTMEGKVNNYDNVQVGFYPQIVNDVNYLLGYNEFITGYTSSDFDNYYSGATPLEGNGLKINIGSRINYTPGQIEGSTDGMNIKSYYVYYDKPFTTTQDKGEKVILYPSAGSDGFNQYRFEVTDRSGTVKQPIQQPLFDGSVKTLWGVSHHGYYDHKNISKPDYDEYLKFVDPKTDKQQSFDIESEFEYSSIEEIFAVFNEEILDLFEKEFLDYCKDPNRDKVDTTEYPHLIDSIRSIFLIDRPNLTSISDVDGKTLGTKQKDGLKREVQKLMDVKTIFKQGNPSYFNRRVWGSFSDDTTYIPNQRINFGKYVPNSLPQSTNNQTLAISESQNSEAWEALKLSVGKYRVSGYTYSDDGSVITDFFPEMDIEFTEANVRQLSHIIKIYATKKFENPSMTSSRFMNDFNDYLKLLDKSQDNIQNILFRDLNKILPKNSETEQKIESSMKGDVAKLELYEFFKTLNDKWISGGDFQSRTIFEDFLFFDRANRDIGDKLIIDVNGLRSILNYKNTKNSIYTLISSVIQSNNMLFMALPSYTNFYGVSEPSPNAKPKEGIEDSASSVFGTFTEVDYYDNRPKFLCLFTDRVSTHPDMSSNIDYRYGNDGIKFFQDPTLKEEQTDKNDYAFSNKVVAFNVDFGVRNQGIFKSVSLDQSQYKDTSESFLVLTDMANQAKGSKTFQQSTSLYNIYKNRSYTCQVSSMGNVMIQPTMYFNLRYVPMFTGAYWILNVDHSIRPGEFTTNFSGVRMSKYSFPDVKDLVMSVNLDILERINEKYNQQKTKSESNEGEEVVNEGEQVNVNGERKEVNSSFCSPIQQYEGLPYVDLSSVKLAYSEIISYVDTLSFRGDEDVERLVGLVPYVEFGVGSDNFVKYYNGNLGNIMTDKIINGIDVSEIEGQVCVNVNDSNRPMASFDDWKKSMDVIKTRLTTNSVFNDMSTIGSQQIKNEELYAKIYIKYWYAQIGSDSQFDQIISNPQNQEERNIKERYEQVVPLFKSGMKWYEEIR